MNKYLPKIIWTLALVLGLFFLVRGYSLKNKTSECEEASTGKSGGCKMQSGLDVSNMAHHILDFSR